MFDFLPSGIDWNRGEEDGGSGTLGVVVRKHAQKWVTVSRITFCGAYLSAVKVRSNVH